MRRTGAGKGLLIAVAALIAAVVATAPAAAATPVTKAQYKAMLLRGRAQVGKAERAMQLGLVRKAPSVEMKRLILTWAAAEKQFGESLQGVRPPADVVPENALLSRGAIKYASELRDIADKLPSNASAARSYLGRSVAKATGGALVTDTLTKLRVAGYY